MLVGEFRVQVTEPGTDASLLDPSAPAPENVFQGFISSNPVRINFLPEEAAQ